MSLPSDYDALVINLPILAFIVMAVSCSNSRRRLCRTMIPRLVDRCGMDGVEVMVAQFLSVDLAYAFILLLLPVVEAAKNMVIIFRTDSMGHASSCGRMIKKSNVQQ